jgi:hypothetical protein
MVHGHANLDVLDNCGLHPGHCFGCSFGQKEGIFFEKKVFLVENLISFFEKINQIFNTTKWKNETLILM